MGLVMLGVLALPTRGTSKDAGLRVRAAARTPRNRDPREAGWGSPSSVPLLRKGRVMYEKILVAVDHSKISERALAAARELALLSHGEVWVVHLREREAMGKTGLLTSTESSDEATAAVTAAVASLTQDGIKAHAVVRDTVFGYAAREIVSDAAGAGADVIVMGSRGRGDLAGLVLGSTAHKVIHLADRPVLVVR